MIEENISQQTLDRLNMLEKFFGHKHRIVKRRFPDAYKRKDIIWWRKGYEGAYHWKCDGELLFWKKRNEICYGKILWEGIGENLDMAINSFFDGSDQYIGYGEYIGDFAYLNIIKRNKERRLKFSKFCNRRNKYR